MADKGQFKQTAAVVLGLLESVSSFAATFNPLFGIVTEVIGAAKKGLVGDDKQEDFQQIHEKLESISEKNKQLLDQIHIAEIKSHYGGFEKNIKDQYKGFQDMVEKIRADPEKSEHYREDFKNIYREKNGHQNLNRYYDSIMENEDTFGIPILKVYLKHCNKNKKIMQAECSYLAYLFHIGLIALMAYYVVTEDNKDEFRDEWGPKVSDIQTKMQDVLEECN
ncbi:protein rapunzel-like [Tachysurus fulvidraco]|uniref:protein rapunzel-like n=1 Tax=Tachysurus fulvidraco TaxID=1234273 RepID=UPI000F4D2B1A|nr:protein rapunzel-like [Tachysurus fulvidraco]